MREAARAKGFADLSDVAWAILEADGSFSFISRGQPPSAVPTDGEHRAT